jgi:hypothetical protein
MAIDDFKASMSREPRDDAELLEWLTVYVDELSWIHGVTVAKANEAGRNAAKVVGGKSKP